MGGVELASAVDPPASPRVLSGWGRTAPTRAEVAAPVAAGEVAAALRAHAERGVIARGLGRCYGDAAQNAGGRVLDMTALAGVREVDAERGTATVAAGTSFHDLMARLVPAGWFVPVTPGTRYVTAGGAIAADIHGKNHHRDGSISRHLEWMTLVTPDGKIRRVGPDEDPDAFRATAGGMGLTGVIVEACLRLTPIETSAMRVTTERAPDLDALMARMAETDREHRYSVAWIDCLSRGGALGRGVLTAGDHATRAELPSNGHRPSLAFAPVTRIAAPEVFPSGLLRPAFMRAFNEAWYRRAPRHAVTIESMPAFFHPLDGIRSWNRVYGPRGFVQYQAIVPFGKEDVLRELIERLGRADASSLLGVLKRFGEGNGLLSFPVRGWTLALDMPADVPGLAEVLDGLDELVAEAGGRVYLAKDARLRPELIEAMYPELGEWRRIQRRLDPEGVMASDLARRLGLVSA
jgi:decaprenylphospho-beta-D-ribofuranose 2-oxidase